MCGIVAGDLVLRIAAIGGKEPELRAAHADSNERQLDPG
jgi:hypothetical protein